MPPPRPEPFHQEVDEDPQLDCQVSAGRIHGVDSGFARVVVRQQPDQPAGVEVVAEMRREWEPGLYTRPGQSAAQGQFVVFAPGTGSEEIHELLAFQPMAIGERMSLLPLGGTAAKPGIEFEIAGTLPHPEMSSGLDDVQIYEYRLRRRPAQVAAQPEPPAAKVT